MIFLSRARAITEWCALRLLAPTLEAFEGFARPLHGVARQHAPVRPAVPFRRPISSPMTIASDRRIQYQRLGGHRTISAFRCCAQGVTIGVISSDASRPFGLSATSRSN